MQKMMKFEKELYNSRILVIDDDHSISTIIKESLTKMDLIMFCPLKTVKMG